MRLPCASLVLAPLPRQGKVCQLLRTPTLNTLLKLCTAMKIDPSVLFPQTASLSKDEAKKTIINLIELYL